MSSIYNGGSGDCSSYRNSELDPKNFQKITQALSGQPVTKVMNSIGFVIFIEFGQELIEVYKPGKKATSTREQTIAIESAPWRLSRNGEYLVGAGDPRSGIELYLKTLLGRRFRSLQISSHYFDLAIEFEGGYQVETFFNWVIDSQWYILFPHASFELDLEDPKELSKVTVNSSQFPITEPLFPYQLPVIDAPLEEFFFDEDDHLVLIFEGGCSIQINSLSYRVEQNQNYLFGGYDEVEDVSCFLSPLVGEKMIKFEFSETKWDAKITFENGWTIQSFADTYASLGQGVILNQ